MAFLEVSNLSKKYTTNGHRVRILEDINCQFEQGQIHVILGPSGCGKTTLLYLMAGLIRPERGEIRLMNEKVSAPRNDIGVVFQDLRLFPWLKAEQNVAFALRQSHLQDIDSRVAKYLDMVGLLPFAKYYPFQLSGGMKQRLAIVRSLVREPALLLMDEPFGSLDPKTRKQMQALLLRLHKTLQTTTLFVTHDIDEALALGDKIYILSGVPGRITRQFTNQEADATAQTVDRLKKEVMGWL